MVCPDDQALLELLGGSADPARFAELEVHIDGCAHCRKAMAAFALGSRSPSAPHQPFAGLDAELAVGSTVHERYVVGAELGRGGMGTVYVARDTTLGRDVALKLHRAGSGADRLQREAVAMAKLAHPNVVNVFEVATVDDRMFVAMEYVRGGTLRGWLAAQPRSWREIVAMLVDAGRGLAAAHAAGLVHRDFKPENVLVGDDGRPRVGDFGLARTEGLGAPAASGRASVSPTAHTVTAGLAGTPAYMAPEQLAGDPIDARSDQFAFSVVAWECLFGKRPFSGATLAALELAIEEHDLERPGGVPDRVRRVIERGLASAPGTRWPDMPAMLAALTRAAAPRTARNALATAAAAAVIGAGAYAISIGVVRHQREAACELARDRVAAVFDVPIRVALRNGFVGTGSAAAPSAFDHAAVVLDRYTVALAAQAGAVCRDREQPERVASARKACLATRTAELAGLVAELSRADADLVRHAPDAAWGVFEPSPCTDANLATTPIHAAADASELARAKALLRTGRFADGRKVAAELVARARAAKDGSLELDALLVLGPLEDEVEPQSAVATYHEAETLAEAQGRDLDAAVALDALANAAGTVQHEFVTAHRQLDLARAKVARIGGNAAIEGKLAMTEAQILIHENRLGEAERVMQRSLAMLGPVYGLDHPSVGTAEGVLSQVESALGHYPEALAAARKTLEILGAALGPEHPTVAGSKLNLASVLIDGHDDAGARALLVEADAIFRRTYGDDHPLRAAIYGQLGTAEMAQEHWEPAIAAFRTARSIIERTGNDPSAIAGVDRDLTNALGGAGRLDEALAEARHGIAALERLGPDGAPRLAESLNDLCEVQLARGHAAEAIPDAQRALTLVMSRPQDANPGDVADTQFILGKLLWEANRDRAHGHALVELAARSHPVQDRRNQMTGWLQAHAR